VLVDKKIQIYFHVECEFPIV